MNDNHDCVCAHCGEAMRDGIDRRANLVSPLDIAPKWLLTCAILIFAQTLGFTALVAWREIAKGVAGVNEFIIAVVSGTSPAVPLFMVYAIIAVTALDFIGGGIMVTARYLTKKLIEPLDKKRKEEMDRLIRDSRAEGVKEGVKRGVAQGRAEGVAEGRAEGVEEGRAEGAERAFRAWAEWNDRRMEAEADGLPFDEPPPSEW